MRVIIQHRRVVNVESITAVVDDVDTTFVLIEGQLIRVAEKYRKHVKESVYYWRSLFRKSNELLRHEISMAWKATQPPEESLPATTCSDSGEDTHEETDSHDTTVLDCSDTSMDCTNDGEKATQIDAANTDEEASKSDES